MGASGAVAGTSTPLYASSSIATALTATATNIPMYGSHAGVSNGNEVQVRSLLPPGKITALRIYRTVQGAADSVETADLYKNGSIVAGTTVTMPAGSAVGTAVVVSGLNITVAAGDAFAWRIVKTTGTNGSMMACQVRMENVT